MRAPGLMVPALAAGMLVTGTINTICIKYQDLSVVGHAADGTPLYFRHPAVQAAFMFFGESLCLIPYFLLRWRKSARRAAGLEPPSSRPKRPRSFFVRRALTFAIPALCDSITTTLLNLGLFYTNASTYQMLRGTLVLFAGMFTLLILRRRLFIHHWMGMVLIVAGAAIVGAASIVYAGHADSPPPSPFTAWPSPPLLDSTHGIGAGEGAAPLSSLASVVPGLSSLLGAAKRGAGLLSQRLARLREQGPADPLFGDILVVVAQGFCALQFILEEKLLGAFKMQPLVAVGLEGMWGLVLCLFALPLLTFTTVEGRPLDDLPAAIREIGADPRLRNAVLLGIASIGVFNFLGLSVTKALSGASRATIDACRTLFVWLVALWAGWEAFHNLQVVGFIVLVSGTSLYNEILRPCLPHVYPTKFLEDDESSSVSSAGGDDTAGDTDLEAPLLAAVHANGSGGAAGSSGSGGASGSGSSGNKKSDKDRGVNIPTHHDHTQAQYCMARSLTLGVTTFSPRPLDEEGHTPVVNVGDILEVSPSCSLPNTQSILRAPTPSEDGLVRHGVQVQNLPELPLPPPPSHQGPPEPDFQEPPPEDPSTEVQAAAGGWGSPAPAAAVGAPVAATEAALPAAAAHATHTYKPGGQLQHALAAAGQAPAHSPPVQMVVVQQQQQQQPHQPVAVPAAVAAPEEEEAQPPVPPLVPAQVAPVTPAIAPPAAAVQASPVGAVAPLAPAVAAVATPVAAAVPPVASAVPTAQAPAVAIAAPPAAKKTKKGAASGSSSGTSAGAAATAAPSRADAKVPAATAAAAPSPAGFNPAAFPAFAATAANPSPSAAQPATPIAAAPTVLGAAASKPAPAAGPAAAVAPALAAAPAAAAPAAAPTASSSGSGTGSEQQATAASSSSAEAPGPSKPAAGGGGGGKKKKSSKKKLVDVLLGNSASRVQRGTCTCIHCRGKGAMACPACSARGTVQAGQGTARMNLMRHAVSKLEGLINSSLGVGTQQSGQEWKQTNRCRRCHGVGQLVCSNCNGTGLRFKAGPDDVCELPDPSQKFQ